MPVIGSLAPAAGAAATRRRQAEKARRKFVTRRDDKVRAQASQRAEASEAAGNEDGDLRHAARLQKEDIKTTIEIVHNTNESLKETDTGEPSRLVKDLFLEPSGALHEEFESMKLDSTDPDSAEFLGCCRQAWLHKLAVRARQTRDHVYFQTTIIAFIVIAGVLVGLQTYELEPRFGSEFVSALLIVDQFVLAVFAVEIVIKVAAQGRHPSKFVYDPANGNLQAWNIFDFIVVLVGYLPFDTAGVTSLRTARLVRVLKLVRALPKLRILVEGLLRSLTSIAYIALLLLLLFYLYAVLGVTVFGKNDPVHFGSLHIALITLFQCATLEDWSDVMYTNFYGCDLSGYELYMAQCTQPRAQPQLASVYFVSFIVLSSMLVLNTFVSVITTSMGEARRLLEGEEEGVAASKDDMDDDEYLEAKLNELTDVMAKIADEVEHFALLEKQRRSRAEAGLDSDEGDSEDGAFSEQEDEGDEEHGGDTSPWSPPVSPAVSSASGSRASSSPNRVPHEAVGFATPKPQQGAATKSTTSSKSSSQKALLASDGGGAGQSRSRGVSMGDLGAGKSEGPSVDTDGGAQQPPRGSPINRHRGGAKAGPVRGTAAKSDPPRPRFISEMSEGGGSTSSSQFMKEVLGGGGPGGEGGGSGSRSSSPTVTTLASASMPRK